MGDWDRICKSLSELLEDNKDLNFGIQLSPEQVSRYLMTQVMCVRITENHKAALFVTNDGECGFISYKNPSTQSYRHLTTEFTNFAATLPEQMRKHLWCKVQNNNTIVHGLAKRLGFKKDLETNDTTFYTYGG